MFKSYTLSFQMFFAFSASRPLGASFFKKKFYPDMSECPLPFTLLWKWRSDEGSKARNIVGKFLENPNTGYLRKAAGNFLSI